MVDASDLRRLLAAHEFNVDGTKYGVVLWRVESAAPASGSAPTLHLDLTAAPTSPSDEVQRFTLDMPRDLALDPLTLLAAIAARLQRRTRG
jgi:hypothetical protein